MNKKPIIIDTDPGVDDALALITAFAAENLDIKLLTSVGGNVKLERTTLNLLHLTEIFGKDIPVAVGGTSQSKYKISDASNVHGECGLGRYGYTRVNRKPIRDDAVSAIYDTLKNSEQKVTIVGIGPETNISELLLKHPDSKQYIEEIVLMGGSNLGRGNVTDYAEFNIRFDVESAMNVLHSSVKKVYVPMEMGHEAFLDMQDMERIKNTNKVGEMVSTMSEEYRDQHVRNGVATHDSCAIAYVIDKSIFKTKKAKMIIDMTSEERIGCTVCDYQSNAPNVEICLDINKSKFKNLIFKSIENLS